MHDRLWTLELNAITMKIKDLKITGRTFLAPLAGITNLPFRLLVKTYGCSVVCSEMISAKGIFYNSKKTLKLLASEDKERPFSVQLFGSEPKSMAKAAAFIENLGIADILDINFGCSVKKVVKQGAGAALMREPDLSMEILSAVRAATDLPLSIKIRTGWDASGIQAETIAGIAQDCGVDAIAVHPRTAGQLFKGRADWTIIKRIKQVSKIPVIGNGDILTPEDAKEMIDTTGCDGVMVGRAAMRNPFLLSQIDHYLSANDYTPPTPAQVFEAMKQLTQMYISYFGEDIACKMLRGRLTWFVKGMAGSASFRKRLSQIRSGEQALSLISEFELNS